MCYSQSGFQREIKPVGIEVDTLSSAEKQRLAAYYWSPVTVRWLQSYQLNSKWFVFLNLRFH